MLKQVLCIFRRLKKIFIKYFYHVFLTQVCADRPGRSTRTVDRTMGRSTDMHRLVHVWQTQTRSTVRVDRVRELCSLFVWVDRPVDRGCPTVTFLTVGGRPGRSTGSLSGCQLSLTANFLMGLYKPQFFGILAKVFRDKISRLSLLF